MLLNSLKHELSSSSGSDRLAQIIWLKCSRNSKFIFVKNKMKSKPGRLFVILFKSNFAMLCCLEIDRL